MPELRVLVALIFVVLSLFVALAAVRFTPQTSIAPRRGIFPRIALERSSRLKALRSCQIPLRTATPNMLGQIENLIPAITG